MAFCRLMVGYDIISGGLFSVGWIVWCEGIWMRLGELMSYGPLIYSGLNERGAIEFVKQVISRGVCGLFEKLVQGSTSKAESIHLFLFLRGVLHAFCFHGKIAFLIGVRVCWGISNQHFRIQENSMWKRRVWVRLGRYIQTYGTCYRKHQNQTWWYSIVCRWEVVNGWGFFSTVCAQASVRKIFLAGAGVHIARD